MSDPLLPIRGTELVATIPTLFEDVVYDATIASAIAFVLRKEATGSESEVILGKSLGHGITATSTGIVLTIPAADIYGYTLGWPYVWTVTAAEIDEEAEEATYKEVASGVLRLSKENNGTGAPGNMLYRDADGVWTEIPIGLNLAHLTSDGEKPVWENVG